MRDNHNNPDLFRQRSNTNHYCSRTDASYHPIQSKKRVLCRGCVLGAASAGKTSILRRYFHKTFDPSARGPTLGSDFYTGRMANPLDNKGDGGTDNENQNHRHPMSSSTSLSSSDRWVRIQIWDTPGRDRFNQHNGDGSGRGRKEKRKYASYLGDSFFQHLDAIMLVYDMTSSTSFTQLLKWYADVMELQKQQHQQQNQHQGDDHQPPMPVLIVANKLDLFRRGGAHCGPYDGALVDMRQGERHRPQRVPQRDVLGLAGKFRGNDFCYEYQVSPPVQSTSTTPGSKGSSTAYFLANRENWTTDGSYLESLLHSEDGSHPDREMVLLWCMRNGLEHMEVSAATGEGVDEAVEALIRLALLAKIDNDIDDRHGAAAVHPSFVRRNPKLDLREMYAPAQVDCCFALLRPLRRLFRLG